MYFHEIVATNITRACVFPWTKSLTTSSFVIFSVKPQALVILLLIKHGMVSVMCEQGVFVLNNYYKVFTCSAVTNSLQPPVSILKYLIFNVLFILEFYVHKFTAPCIWHWMYTCVTIQTANSCLQVVICGAVPSMVRSVRLYNDCSSRHLRVDMKGRVLADDDDMSNRFRKYQ